MRKIAALAVVVVVAGCSSSSASYSAAPESDATSDVSDSSDGGGGDAVAVRDADAAEEPSDTRAPQFECLRTSECTAGVCCAHISSGVVDGSVCMTSTTTCAAVFTDGGGSIACGSPSDCPSTASMCCGGHARGWCAASC